MAWTCACCLKVLPDRAIAWEVLTAEGEEVDIGSDCGKRTRAAGTAGYSPANGASNETFYTRSAWEEQCASS